MTTWPGQQIGGTTYRPQTADPYRIPPDPILAQRAQAEEERKRQAEARQFAGTTNTITDTGADNARADAAAAADLFNKGLRPDGRGGFERIPGWTPAPTGAANPAADRLNDAKTLRLLIDEYERVADPYMGQTTGGEAWAQVNPFDRLNTEGMRARETTAQNILPLIRRLMRTPGDPQAQLETSAYDSYLPSINATDDENRRRVKVLRGMADQIDPPRVPERDRREPPLAGVAPPNASPPAAPGSDMSRPFTPVAPSLGPAENGTRTVEDPRLAALVPEYRARLAANQSAEEILNWLRSKNVSSETLAGAVAQIQYRRANPNVPIESYGMTSSEEVPLSMYEKLTAAAAALDYRNFNPASYALGAGQFLSGNTLDNLTDDPERARLSSDVMRATNPGSTLAGEITGGAMAALTGEAGLARLGMASGFGRGLLADAAMGGANGAGMADNGDRWTGALEGAGEAGVGSLLGTGAAKVAGRALAPTGGPLAPLYDAGVRPTPGQRFANSGTPGRILNATEEALQSVPVVGTAVRGARQNARDQFQVGAFNEALSEIGEQLPRGMKAGTDPHAFAQARFKVIYDNARSSMRLVADADLSNDLGQLAPDIATLGPQAQQKLRAIMDNTVNNRAKGGVMSGGAYKKAVSDLGRHIARLGKSAMAEDQQLAEVLQGVRGALDSAARRHSPPDAVALLDAADAGYAKLVRIEEAAMRRGPVPGEFSPANFDSAVQKTSGGVRSKAYLRGDALMQDYATAGRSLDDKLPNSGTADRALTVGGLGAGAAAFFDPTVLSALGTIGVAYAPGVRKVVSGSMAPAGPGRKWIAQQLEKRARLIGRVGAAGAVASLQGTTPGQ